MSTPRAEVTGSNTEICRVGGHPGDMNLFSSRGQIFQKDHHTLWQVPVACFIFPWINSVTKGREKGEEREFLTGIPISQNYPCLQWQPGFLVGKETFDQSFCQVAQDGNKVQATSVPTHHLPKDLALKWILRCVRWLRSQIRCNCLEKRSSLFLKEGYSLLPFSL